MTKEYTRSQRIASQLQRELANLIRHGLRDPRIGWVTVDDVEVNRDLSLARVYVSTLEDARLEAVLEALNRAAPFLRRELGRRLHLRMIPELRFYQDTAIEQGRKMTRLLDRIAAEQSADPPSGGASDEP